jgi:DNA-directed RNA polymerase specialized sigma24 family protein
MLRVATAAAAYQARRIARTLRLSPTDRQDAEQQVLLALLERRRFFDVARGPWTPFVHRVARQAAQGIADGFASELRRAGGWSDEVTESDEVQDSVLESVIDNAAPSANDILYVQDLHRFMTTLPAELRLVAGLTMMAEGEISEAQRASGLSTSEFYRRLREVRYRLMAAGLADIRFLDAP